MLLTSTTPHYSCVVETVTGGTTDKEETTLVRVIRIEIETKTETVHVLTA
jgi:hypothetical protein